MGGHGRSTTARFENLVHRHRLCVGETDSEVGRCCCQGSEYPGSRAAQLASSRTPATLTEQIGGGLGPTCAEDREHPRTRPHHTWQRMDHLRGGVSGTVVEPFGGLRMVQTPPVPSLLHGAVRWTVRAAVSMRTSSTIGSGPWTSSSAVRLSRPPASRLSAPIHAPARVMNPGGLSGSPTCRRVVFGQ
jgi:hypothetical protein